MKKEVEIETKIKQLIDLLDRLIVIEDFNAYKKLRANYYEVYNSLLNRKKSASFSEIDFRKIQSSFRIFFEAPPKNEILGLEIIKTMQEIYELQIQILDSNK